MLGYVHLPANWEPKDGELCIRNAGSTETRVPSEISLWKAGFEQLHHVKANHSTHREPCCSRPILKLLKGEDPVVTFGKPVVQVIYFYVGNSW